MAKRGRRPRNQTVEARPTPALPKRATTWHRTEEFVDGTTALSMIGHGEAWFVEECESEPAVGNQRMFDYIRANLVDAAMMKKYARKKTVPTVFVAERWTNDEGDHALLFVEQGPHPRIDPGPLEFPAQ